MVAAAVSSSAKAGTSSSTAPATPTAGVTAHDDDDDENILLTSGNDPARFCATAAAAADDARASSLNRGDINAANFVVVVTVCGASDDVIPRGVRVASVSIIGDSTDKCFEAPGGSKGDANSCCCCCRARAQLSPFTEPNSGFEARDQLFETGANLMVDAPFELVDDVLFTLSLHLAPASVAFDDDDVIVAGELNSAV